MSSDSWCSDRFFNSMPSETRVIPRTPTASVPQPMMRGATPTTIRSTTRDMSIDVMTFAPPSTSSDSIPSARNVDSAAAQVDAVGTGWNHSHVHVALQQRRSAIGVGVLRREDQGPCVRLQDLRSRVDPERGIEHHPQRRHAGHHTDGELRIVAEDGTDTDEDRIAHGSQTMRDPALVLATDPLGVAGHGGDAAIERLRELQDDIRSIRSRAYRADELRRVHRGGNGRARRSDGFAGRMHMAHPILLRPQVRDIAMMRCGRERLHARDGNARGAQATDLLGVVGEEPHGTHAEGFEHARSIPVVASVDGQPETEIRLDGVVARVLLDVRPQLVQEADTPALVSCAVDEHTATIRGDGPQREAQLHAAIAAQRTQHVTGEAL